MNFLLKLRACLYRPAQYVFNPEQSIALTGLFGFQPASRSAEWCKRCGMCSERSGSRFELFVNLLNNNALVSVLVTS
jgi:hypothetical protein